MFRSPGPSGLRLTLAAAILASACTTVTYPGPRRPSDQVATIEVRKVAIDQVDGMDVKGKTTLEVLPGPRRLVIRLADSTTIPMQTVWLTVWRIKAPMEICFTAVAKHTYTIETRIDGDVWSPFVADGSSETSALGCPIYSRGAGN